MQRVQGTIIQEVANLAQQAYQDPKRLNRTVSVANEKDCQSYLVASLESRGYAVLLEEGIREAFADYRGPQKRSIMMLDRKARSCSMLRRSHVSTGTMCLVCTMFIGQEALGIAVAATQAAGNLSAFCAIDIFLVLGTLTMDPHQLELLAKLRRIHGRAGGASGVLLRVESA